MPITVLYYYIIVPLSAYALYGPAECIFNRAVRREAITERRKPITIIHRYVHTSSTYVDNVVYYCYCDLT